MYGASKGKLTNQVGEETPSLLGGNPMPSLPATTPSVLRSMNGRIVLERIAGDGPISRAELARVCGLSKPTVSSALTDFVASKAVREVGQTSGRQGRSATLYALEPKAGSVLAVDVGRGRIRAAVADLTGTVLARAEAPSRGRTSGALIGQASRLAHDVLVAAGVPGAGVRRTVVGTPGVVRADRDQLALAHNLPGWARPGVVDALQQALGMDVVVENDVNLAAVGERERGHGRGVRDFVFVSVGTGVGMGIVLDGRLHRGASGAAGEIGYLPVGTGDPHDPRSRRRGTLEEAAGAAGVVRAARERGMGPRITARTVFAEARRGNPTALEVVREEGRQIALAVAAVVPVLDPELVILGGGIGANADLLLEPMHAELRTISPFRPRIVVSALRDDAVLEGALATGLAAARDHVFESAAAPAGRRVLAPMAARSE